MSKAYKEAGVDIDAGERLIKAIAPLAKSTARAGADGALGGFGGLFDLKAAGYEDPILISGADGVGTKLKLAFALDQHDTIGIDLVAMCANDVLAQGAEPLFFLDYFATGRLAEGVAASVVAGVAEGCKRAGCALIGGETAEMPGMYQDGEYDIAGFCVGAVERGASLPRNIAAGDVLIGLASSGAHSNGFSLIHKIIRDTGADYAAPSPFAPERTLGDVLLEPTRMYVASLLPLIRQGRIHGFAHVTGGGLSDNVPRILSDDLTPVYDETALALPPLFEWLRSAGDIDDEDMRRTFNCGVGGVVSVAPADADSVLADLDRAGEQAHIIGEVKRAS